MLPACVLLDHDLAKDQSVLSLMLLAAHCAWCAGAGSPSHAARRHHSLPAAHASCRARHRRASCRAHHRHASCHAPRPHARACGPCPWGPCCALCQACVDVTGLNLKQQSHLTMGSGPVGWPAKGAKTPGHSRSSQLKPLRYRVAGHLAPLQYEIPHRIQHTGTCLLLRQELGHQDD